MKSLVEKYKPKISIEIPQQLEQLKTFIKNKEKVLIFGPTGSCKTSSIYTIAKDLDYEIIEVNASDFRTKEQIENIIGQASKQQSLFQKEKILLIDEVECLSGTEDRGGSQAIINILKSSKTPIILTANKYNDKLKDIKKLVKIIEFKPIPSREINSILKNICEKENIIYSEEAIRSIVIDCKGDLRAALNDLQSNTINQELQIVKEEREYEIGIIHILNKIFKTKSPDSHKILENAEIDLEEYILWLDENLPIEYKNENDLLREYELMSKADILKGRIRRWQYWRLMYYQTILLSAGISNAKTNTNNSFTSYKRSMRPLRIWQLNMKNAKKKTIAKKIAQQTHISIKEVIKNFNYYKNILKNKTIQEELKLEEEELDYINSNY